MVRLHVLLACAGAVVGSACASAGGRKSDSPGPAAPAGRAPAELERERAAIDPAGGVKAAAIDAIAKGEFDRARDLLGELLAGVHLEQARAAIAAGDARGALAALDRALEMAPRSASVQCLRGEAALALFDQNGDQDREPSLCESALANFLVAASPSPPSTGAPARTAARAWLGASRAARRLGRSEEAREYARRGLAASTSSNAEADPDLRLRVGALQRTFAEATFDEYLGARSSGASAASIAARARASRDALEGLLGRMPEDAWTWERLAELAQSQGSPADARDLALGGLRIVPDDPALLQRLALASRAVGGPTLAAAILEPFCVQHPDLADAAWELALAHFDAGIEDADHSRDPSAHLAAAELAFARCRDLDPRKEAEARACEAQARGARGLWLLVRADLAGAHKAFLSMQDAAKGGLALEIRGTRLRGVDGLFRVAEAYGERGDPGNPGSIDSLEQAARICDLLHQVEPREARFAAASGRYHRDTAIALELQASGGGPGKSAEADRLLDKARELMEKAFAASRDAAALAPDDERYAAQAGAILARYLQRDAETARIFLEKAVEIGEPRVAVLRASADEKGIPESERQERRKRLEDEQTLVGDACKDLGVVHLELLGDAAKAKECFERARRADPDPRPEIDGLLERCEKAAKGEIDPRLREEDRWAPRTRPGRKA